MKRAYIRVYTFCGALVFGPVLLMLSIDLYGINPPERHIESAVEILVQPFIPDWTFPTLEHLARDWEAFEKFIETVAGGGPQ